MRKSEILAPAGSFEALVAAVRCGANAVYLGSKDFNARQNASNFDFDELKKAVQYCHERNVKVYQTLNILIEDSEMSSALATAQKSCEAGIDALIIQDLGLAALLQRVCPSMPLHASTQMSIQSLEGIRELEKLGFTRVVLPREMSKKELKEIAENTDMEIEYFVHGALCMCVSGQCLLSSFLGGRSGNRGLCAQPCRLPFGVNGVGGNNLSLKDSSLIPYLKELEEIGVTSFKIEGRMKRPEYVAAAVTACKNTLNGVDDEDLNQKLEAVFSRSGFTDGYYKGTLGKNMFGIRRKEDVTAAAPILKELSSLYNKETPLIPVQINITAKLNENLSGEFIALGNRVTVFGDGIIQAAVNRAVTPDEIKERVSKCGNTQFFAEKVYVDCDENIFISAGEINSLRRLGLEKLTEKLSEKKQLKFEFESINRKSHKQQSKQLHIRYFKENQIDFDKIVAERAIVPLDTSPETVERLLKTGTEVFAEIPRGYIGNCERFFDMLMSLKNIGVSGAMAQTLDGVALSKKCSLPYIAGYGMNVYNSDTLEYLKNDGCVDALVSCELNENKINSLSGSLKWGAIVYGKLPLMLTRNCPVKNKISCAECKGKSYLIDRKNIEFPVICKWGFSEILNSRPLYLIDRPYNNTDYDLLYFTNESKEECKKIIDLYQKKGKPEGEFTRGHG